MKKLALRIAKYYWIFVASLLARNRRPKFVEKRILITKFDGLGDFFLLTPFLQNLITNKYEIVCISLSSFSDIIAHLKIPLTFIPFNNNDFHSFTKIIDQVKKTNFCLAVNLSMNVWGGILVNQSCAKTKIGLLQEREHYIYKGSNLLYDKILSYALSTHNFDVLQNVFTDTLNIPPAKQFINTTVKNNNSIIIHPYANWAPRQWPYFSELIGILLKRGYLIRLIGKSSEHLSNNWLSSIDNHHQFLHIPLLSVDHLMTEIDDCVAFIGNDSGPAHYAALIGKPTTVIWGPGFFERIHPVGKNVIVNVIPVNCRPCRQKGNTCVNGENRCLIDISVEMVLKNFENSIIYSQEL